MSCMDAFNESKYEQKDFGIFQDGWNAALGAIRPTTTMDANAFHEIIQMWAGQISIVVSPRQRKLLVDRIVQQPFVLASMPCRSCGKINGHEYNCENPLPE